MILSIDATLALVLTCATLASLFTATQNLDFTINEMAANQLAGDLALALQEEKYATLELQRGNLEAMRHLLENIEQYKHSSNCIEVVTTGNKYGNCDGEKVTRSFLVYNNGVIEAQVAIYFS
ncbi:MAG: hypothetical protein V1722_04475 [Candidatus Micrarchaeota archaeon]